MINIKNDYSEVAHPKVLEHIMAYSMQVNAPYGEDEHCLHAAHLIKGHLNREVDIHFVSGGTLANILSMAAFLRPYQSIIAVETAHIADNETGAIEGTGHKVITVEGEDGKMTPEEIEGVMSIYTHEHKTQPALVYITNATELGTVYTKGELVALREVCDEHGLLLYMDGARLAAALTSEFSDISLGDLAELTDAFFIGGAKNGLMFGEALVLVNDRLKPDFRYMYKNRGAMFSKGFLMGMQFEVLFENDLYFELGRHANRMAALMAEGLLARGIEFYKPRVTNQLFVRLSDEQIERLSEKFLFEVFQYPKDGKVVRFITTWSTTQETIDLLMDFLDGQ